MRTSERNLKTEDLQNTLLCAHWLIGQFDTMGMKSVANIFQRALDDTMSWIGNMSTPSGSLAPYQGDIEIREVKILRSFLIKYASIHNPEERKKALEKMRSAVEKG